jgi:hypothetical protein
MTQETRKNENYKNSTPVMRRHQLFESQWLSHVKLPRDGSGARDWRGGIDEELGGGQWGEIQNGI